MQEIEDKVDKRQIERQVSDWKRRVAKLYSEISTWLKNTEYTLKNGHKLIMYEELMAQFGIPSTEIDTMDIYNGKSFILTLKPKGLWIIGANGRVDILTTNGNYMLVDKAEHFAPPQWKLFNGDKKNGVEFSKETFIKLLK